MLKSPPWHIRLLPNVHTTVQESVSCDTHTTVFATWLLTLSASAQWQAFITQQARLNTQHPSRYIVQSCSVSLICRFPTFSQSLWLPPAVFPQCAFSYPKKRQHAMLKSHTVTSHYSSGGQRPCVMLNRRAWRSLNTKTSLVIFLPKGGAKKSRHHPFWIKYWGGEKE